MSKTELRKTIQKMNQEQLVSLILNLYAAKKEAKDYLDFFVNPDIDSRMEKAREAISKAIFRLKRGMLKPRIKAVKDVVKNISSLTPGEEFVADIMLFAFQKFCTGGMFGRLSDSNLRSIIRFLNDTVAYLDKNGLGDVYFPQIGQTIEELKDSYMYQREFKRIMRETFETALRSCSRRLQ